MSLSFLRLHQQQPFKLYQSPPAQQPFPIPSKSSTSKFSANPLSSSALHQHKSQCQTQSTATPTAARTTRCFPVINNTSIAPLVSTPISLCCACSFLHDNLWWKWNRQMCRFFVWSEKQGGFYLVRYTYVIHLHTLDALLMLKWLIWRFCRQRWEVGAAWVVAMTRWRERLDITYSWWSGCSLFRLGLGDDVSLCVFWCFF